MKMFRQSLIVAALAMGLAQGAWAQDGQINGTLASGQNVADSVNFQVNMQGMLYFRVGSTGATVDTITFDVANPGAGGAVAGTGGDLTGGKVTVEVRSNLDTVNLSSAPTTANLTSGADVIPWSKIVTTRAGSAIPLLAASGTASTAMSASGTPRVINASDTWTYSYTNDTLYAMGTYTGTVVYTAAVP